MMSSSYSSSKSIPIPTNDEKHLENTHSQIDFEHASKVAEWQESQMYQRLLTGMFLSYQRLGNPKIIRSLENLMLTQAIPLSSTDASTTTREKQNEDWLFCRSCESAKSLQEDINGRRRAQSADSCWCSDLRTPSSPSSHPSCNYTVKCANLHKSGTAAKDEDDDGLIFDIEI